MPSCLIANFYRVVLTTKCHWTPKWQNSNLTAAPGTYLCIVVSHRRHITIHLQSLFFHNKFQWRLCFFVMHTK